MAQHNPKPRPILTPKGLSTALANAAAGRSYYTHAQPFSTAGLAAYKTLAATWQAQGGTASIAVGVVNIQLTLG